MKKIFYLIPVLLGMIACQSHSNDYDSSGAFESVETIVSTESSGTIMQFDVEEGMTLKAGQFVGYIDSVQLYLKKQQLRAQIDATVSQIPDIPVQVSSLRASLSLAKINQKRIQKLFDANAATRQQLDDANTQVDVINNQIDAQLSSLGKTSATLKRNVAPFERQIGQINDQLSKCKIINPIHGTVLTKYAENHEVVSPGKALYKIAETDTLNLRAYITGSQLSEVKMGQSVKVRVDKGDKAYRNYTGTIFWISDKAEFTPKTIQTKDERADLVYAIKVRVVNDSFLKIGMYGEVKL
jgi:HlyD family secretion protein